MKKLLFFFLLCVSCTKNSDIFSGDAPFKGNAKSFTFAEKTPLSIIEKTTSFGESNFYAKEGSGDEVFLFNLCATDCNEKIKQSSWGSTHQHFAFLVHNSSRFSNGHRLLLFKFTSPTTFTRLLDSKDVSVKNFAFSSNVFTYTLEDGTQKSINL